VPPQAEYQGHIRFHCSPFHLFRYLDEQTFPLNERRDEDGDLGGLVKVMGTVKNRRLTYRKLTGKTPRRARASSSRGEDGGFGALPQ